MKELTVKNGVTKLGVTTVDGEKAIVSSRDVAEEFNKEHKHVLRDIRELDCSDNFRESNYGLSKYQSGNRKYKEYLITKDGLVFLVMGYNGKKAAELKEAYIKQFNRMEKLIKNREFARVKYKPMTDAIKEFRQNQGKTPKFYHYSNEADMLNKIVLGLKAKQYCKKHDIPRDSLRDHLPKWQLKALHKLEVLNTDLLHMQISYEERKEMLSKKFEHMQHNNLKLTS